MIAPIAAQWQALPAERLRTSRFIDADRRSPLLGESLRRAEGDADRGAEDIRNKGVFIDEQAVDTISNTRDRPRPLEITPADELTSVKLRSVAPCTPPAKLNCRLGALTPT